MVTEIGNLGLVYLDQKKFELAEEQFLYVLTSQK